MEAWRNKTSRRKEADLATAETEKEEPKGESLVEKDLKINNVGRYGGKYGKSDARTASIRNAYGEYDVNTAERIRRTRTVKTSSFAITADVVNERSHKTTNNECRKRPGGE
eukprot:3473128-Pyramimonas_sp.AAC.2